MWVRIVCSRNNYLWTARTTNCIDITVGAESSRLYVTGYIYLPHWVCNSGKFTQRSKSANIENYILVTMWERELFENLPRIPKWNCHNYFVLAVTVDDDDAVICVEYGPDSWVCNASLSCLIGKCCKVLKSRMLLKFIMRYLVLKTRFRNLVTYDGDIIA